VRKWFALERLEQDLDALLENLAVGILVEQRVAESLDFAGVVAAPDAEDDPPAGQDVGHRVILGEAQRMHIGTMLKPQPMLMFFAPCAFEQPCARKLALGGTGEYVALLGKQRLDPIDYRAHAGGAAQITVDDDPVFSRDFGDRRR
jgi:hypothetical protein